ncbi:MAG: Glutamine cyclotransferase [Candidatus Electronema aureum]|uniref:Glutamine cyclotransferase n=1 Tax=Candidatus Electronema aureum TaxID=2005002 RepID=A0A521G0W9_9BACT|nr:MAG: Glutamine cyclotransferase [Candidatus Electronema aureum]
MPTICCAACVILFTLFFQFGCHSETSSPAQLAAIVIKEYPHDRNAFTQGLVWDQGRVYEGTGLHKRSSLRRIDLVTGNVEQQLDYAPQFFAEGITVFQDSIYQLTWQNQNIFQYDKGSFALRNTWSWPCEGWGITHDGSSLIVSDGTATLYFLDPTTLVEKRQITVRDHGQEIDRLNELEYVNGTIYANIWKECRIVVISPETGVVTAWLDLSELCARMQNGNAEAVLNGIMHDPEQDRLFVTGKLWPALFEIRTVPAQQKKP